MSSWIRKPSGVRTAMRFMLLYGMGLAVGVSASGCSGACADAKDLCQVCEVEAIGNCDRYDDLDSDSCEKAITAYESNCPDAA